MTLLVAGLRSGLFGPVDLQVARGECVAVQGPSGSGKTLLLRAIADLDPAKGGRSLDGRSHLAMSGPDWRRAVRYAAAEPGWWDDRVAAHFRDPQRAAEAAGRLGLPPACMDWSVTRASTGERQRLALLRAVEDGPAVLLLDEPTAALDAAAEAAAERLLRELMAGGTGILLVTHSAGQAARLARRRLVMQGGRLVPEQAGEAAP